MGEAGDDKEGEEGPQKKKLQAQLETGNRGKRAKLRPVIIVSLEARTAQKGRNGHAVGSTGPRKAETHDATSGRLDFCPRFSSTLALFLLLLMLIFLGSLVLSA